MGFTNDADSGEAYNPKPKTKEKNAMDLAAEEGMDHFVMWCLGNPESCLVSGSPVLF